MKKPTISLGLLEEKLAAVADSLAATARFDLHDQGVCECIDVGDFTRKFFSFGTPSPAPSHGRGERIHLLVGWIWWPSEIDADRGAAMTASMIAEIPGVEEIGEPKLDPQFGLVWQLEVVIRASQ